MGLLSYILFALALNLDSFGAGMAYGARQIKVPPLSLLIICMFSVAAISASMLGGQILMAFIPASFARRLGGVLLLLIGLLIICQSRRNDSQTETEKKACRNNVKSLIEIHIRPLGLAIQILKEPARADVDNSGAISPREALVLGTALAMDAFGAGFSFSLLGFSTIIAAPLVGLGQFLLTYLGIQVGRTMTSCKIVKQLTALPGCIMILLGLIKIY